MTLTSPHIAEEKISREFRSRLAGLKSGQRINVILLLRIPEAQAATNRRVRGQRAGIMSEVRRESAKGLEQIDRVLACHDGKRMAESTSVLGTVPIEITVEGIEALQELEQVKAILEDQGIHSLAMQG
ncbi:MAG: DNA primase [Gammaproteobacteria bacterium]|nr:DNA primase [Gammaproteobacteria bacterium]